MEGTAMAAIDPLTAGGVLLATALTDAVYVLFTSAVVARRRVPAATWSSIWYLLSSYAVISYTENWVYVAFAAAGSWIGAFASITFLHRPPRRPPVRAAPAPFPATPPRAAGGGRCAGGGFSARDCQGDRAGRPAAARSAPVQPARSVSG